jgi:hypothetical protein
MKRVPRVTTAAAALIGAAVALSLAACTADVPSAPSATRAPTVAIQSPAPSDLLGLDLDLGGTLSGVTETLAETLARLSVFPCETPAFGSVTQVIGPRGGVIRVGPHSLYVPPRSLDAPVAITATATAGRYVRVDFQPHGLNFRYGAVLTLSYAHCDREPTRPKIVYVNDLLSVLELLPSLDQRSTDKVSATIRHFSGYAFAD